MNLREQAEADNAIILEDDVAGFGVEITFTNPDDAEETVTVKGQFTRISVEVDPETGLMVQGSTSEFTVRLSSLGEVIPKEDWEVKSTDITGAAFVGYCQAPMPDYTSGRLTVLARG